jgi:hypothetical protein
LERLPLMVKLLPAKSRIVAAPLIVRLLKAEVPVRFPVAVRVVPPLKVTVPPWAVKTPLLLQLPPTVSP